MLAEAVCRAWIILARTDGLSRQQIERKLALRTIS